MPSLFATVPDDTPVIVVEGCTPAGVRRDLAALQRARPFEWLALDRFVTPHEARNLGFDRVGTEFVVFADNDIIYEPHWLARLEENALRTGAEVVAPLICIGPPMATIIHHAGGELVIAMGTDRPRIRERHRMKGESVAAVAAAAGLERAEVAEFHCLLARSATVRRLGPLDERLITREQIDFALRLALAGAVVTFEPGAVVTYAAKNRFSPDDLQYHLFRWSAPLARRSVDAFEQSWNVESDKERVLDEWIRRHRMRAIASIDPARARSLGAERFRNEVALPIERELTSAAFATRRGAPPPRVPPPPDAQARARFYIRRLRPAAPVADPAPARPPVVAGMATMPSRGETLALALASIVPQVDRLFLFLDRFETPPPRLDPKVVPLRSQDFGDLRANGKLLGLLMCADPSVYLTVDDDILYPEGYARRMAAHVAAAPVPAALGVHGSRLKPQLGSYRDDRFVVHRTMEVARPVPVQVLGTDGAAFDTSVLRFDVRTWPQVNMVDLGFALECARRGVARFVVPRARLWIRPLDYAQPDSIYVRLQEDDRAQTDLARELLRLDGEAAPTARRTAAG
ncbi:MAG: glycosyltransferase family 2 protein [Alphaproteobacteria bacterium]|nr:glycosyltransferase family 2 protein [Alphaproteobacteria bacterium]